VLESLLLLSMMILIIGFTCLPTIHFKFFTKCDSFFITKCDKCYYKVRQELQSATIVLQSATEHGSSNDCGSGSSSGSGGGSGSVRVSGYGYGSGGGSGNGCGSA